MYILFYYDFPGGSDDKTSAYNAGDPSSIPGLGRSPGEGNGNPLPAFLPGKSHGQRSLVGYSPWGRKESDMTERLHFHFFSSMYRVQYSKDTKRFNDPFLPRYFSNSVPPEKAIQVLTIY